MDNTTITTDQISLPAIDIEELKRKGNVFRENEGASIIDIGDKVALVEFHTKANSLSDVILDMLSAAVHEGLDNFDAIVIGNRGRHFSAGANLPWLLEAVRAGKFNDIEESMRRLQEINMLLKYGPVPVVAAPFSNALGGGCEIVMHSSRVIASEDLHLGLVEAGVGLIPAGGGTKELRLRALSNFATDGDTDLIHALQHVFEVLFRARVSKNGEEAKRLFLSKNDIVTNSRQSAIEHAKQVALELVEAGYSNAGPATTIPAPGRTALSIFENNIDYLLDSKAITVHDAIIGQHLAKILCGGDGHSSLVTEQHLLDLEREAFISLLGTARTQERIEYLLRNNKPLHN